MNMIACLDLNPSLDLTVTLKKIAYDDINRIEKIERDPAGKGLNIARILHRLGSKTVVFGFLGGYTGAKIRELLDEEGVKHKFIDISDDNRSNITINFDNSKSVKINEAGPRICEKDLTCLLKSIGGLSGKDFVVISGSLPSGVDKNIYAKIIRSLEKKGVKTILDSDGDPFYLGVMAKPFMIKPNAFEAERLLKRMGYNIKIRSERDLLAAAKILSGMGMEIVIISWGSRGIIAASKGMFWRAYSKTRFKYAGVGAGDAVIAGFLYQYSMGQNMEKCIKWAVACGIASVRSEGTKLCSMGGARSFLKGVEIRSIH